jgi:hypothetical protein
MTTIVMNTLNAAVTEYDWAFQSITPTHAGDATGLFSLTGDTDNAVAIDAEAMTGKTDWGTSLKKRLGDVFLTLQGSGAGEFLVTAAAAYAYPVTVRANGESSSKPGMGINENFLAFGYRNVAGADFRLDRIEIPVNQSKQRRAAS